MGWSQFDIGCCCGGGEEGTCDAICEEGSWYPSTAVQLVVTGGYQYIDTFFETIGGVAGTPWDTDPWEIDTDFNATHITDDGASCEKRKFVQSGISTDAYRWSFELRRRPGTGVIFARLIVSFIKNGTTADPTNFRFTWEQDLSAETGLVDCESLFPITFTSADFVTYLNVGIYFATVPYAADATIVATIVP